MPDLPTGTVTFLFTDIEGSTRLWEQHPEAMQQALARHDALLHHAIQTHGGHVFKTIGDQFCATFATAPEAVAAAVAAQRAVCSEEWREVGSVRVRMALNTGAVAHRGGDYFGAPLNRVARLLAAGHGGQVLLSQATADRVREALPPEMSLRDRGAHRLKDLQQPEHIFQLLSPGLPADFPPLRSLEAFAHNLPAQLTSFIGREREMGEVKRQLASNRLLTLTGSGGCGKTRLALQAAVEALEEYADGVWLVELAALADPTLVPQAVAAALGVREESGRALLATLADYLRPKSLLLILDNCEHLLDACAQLAEMLLRACPKLCILASSREGLGIAGETSYRVPSLSLPDLRHLPPVDQLLQFEAVRLFTDRAAAALPSFTVTPQNAPAMAQLCHRLDGIPLALELAAARVKALPVEKLNERLDDMFRLLTGGSRTALPRQQTLRALIDWSHDLLTGPEQALLRRLSVFAGGWALEAAETVSTGGEVEECEVLDLLTTLVEKSLVLYEERGGEGRYRLLETVRQYARDRLLEAGEAETVRARHLEFFLRLAEETAPKLSGAEQAEWLGRLEAEHANLRAALAWSEEGAETEAGLRLGMALCRFWSTRGYFTEGREQLKSLLALESAADYPTARARALSAAGWLTAFQGDVDAAREMLEESLALGRQLGDRQTILESLIALSVPKQQASEWTAAQSLLEEALALASEWDNRRAILFALGHLALTLIWQGKYEAALAYHQRAQPLVREMGEPGQMANLLCDQGWVLFNQGDFGAARSRLQQSLALARELGQKRRVAIALFRLGRLAFREGDLEAAHAFAEESVAVAREMGGKQEIVYSLIGLGQIARHEGDYTTGHSLAVESLALARAMGSKHLLAWSLDDLAEAAAGQGASERAVRLYGAADALRQAIGCSVEPPDQADYTRQVTALRATLGEEAFAAGWAEGCGLPLEQAISYAMEEGDGG